MFFVQTSDAEYCGGDVSLWWLFRDKRIWARVAELLNCEPQLQIHPGALFQSNGGLLSTLGADSNDEFKQAVTLTG